VGLNGSLPTAGEPAALGWPVASSPLLWLTYAIRVSLPGTNNVQPCVSFGSLVWEKTTAIVISISSAALMVTSETVQHEQSFAFTIARFQAK
jgi:hypothetical protein